MVKKPSGAAGHLKVLGFCSSVVFSVHPIKILSVLPTFLDILFFFVAITAESPEFWPGVKTEL
jgi:hypothetical protein